MTGKRLLKTTVCLISILAISALLTALTFPYPSRNDPYKWFNTNDANDVYVYWDANDFTHAYDIIFFLEGGGEVLFGFQGDKLKITGMENCDEVAAEFFKHFIKPMADAYVEDKLEDPNDGTITHAAIETDHSLAIDFDTSDTPDYVQISIR